MFCLNHSVIFDYFSCGAASIKMVTITLPPEFGYVILAGVSMAFVNFWLMMKVGGKRKELGVEYPLMYCT